MGHAREEFARRLDDSSKNQKPQKFKSKDSKAKKYS